MAWNRVKISCGRLGRYGALAPVTGGPGPKKCAYAGNLCGCCFRVCVTRAWSRGSSVGSHHITSCSGSVPQVDHQGPLR